MTRKTNLITLALLLVTSVDAFANIYGAVRGIVHDPQHRPVQGAMVMLKAKSSDWTKSVTTDASGEFAIQCRAPWRLFHYRRQPGIRADSPERYRHLGHRHPWCTFNCSLAAATETVTVSGAPEVAPTDSARPSLWSAGRHRAHARRRPQQQPGHDHRLRSRRLFHPRPAPHSRRPPNQLAGRWRARPEHQYRLQHRPAIRSQGHRLSGGRARKLRRRVRRPHLRRLQRRPAHRLRAQQRRPNWFSAPETSIRPTTHFSFGSHTERFAYYASVNGNRSNLGIQTPVPQMVHDAENGYGGFGSLIFNVDPSNQLRLVTSLRKDYYQIPYDPFPNDIENAHSGERFQAQYPSIGLRDGEHESDAIVNFSWVHTFNSKTAADRLALLSLQQRRLRQLARRLPDRHHRQSRLHLWRRPGQLRRQRGQKQSADGSLQLLPAATTNCSASSSTTAAAILPFTDSDTPPAAWQRSFIDDKFKPFSWLTLTAGMRPDPFFRQASPRTPSARASARLLRSPAELDLPRLLRPLLSGAAADHRFRPATRFLQRQNLRIHPAPRRTRRRTSVRGHHPLSRMDSRR